MSFQQYTFLFLMKANLSFFLLWFLCPKISLPTPKSQRLFCAFSKLIVLVFTLRSMIYFWLSWMVWIRVWDWLFFFLHDSSTIFWTYDSFPFNYLGSFAPNQLTIYVCVYLWTNYCISLNSIFIFMTLAHSHSWLL